MPNNHRRTFDWKPRFDERSRRFGVSEVVPDQPEVKKLWAAGPVLDQGQEGACVGFGWTGELMAAPKPFRPTAEVGNAYAQAYYEHAKTLDEWPGEDYEGTSVLAGAKTAVERGFLTEYRWCFGVEDVRRAVIGAGPVVIGVKWADKMYDTSDQGLVSIGGENVGGHCLVITGYDPAMSFNEDGKRVHERVFRWRNSWGNQYGRVWRGQPNGNGWIRYSDLSTLLEDDGEACIPTGRRTVRF